MTKFTLLTLSLIFTSNACSNGHCNRVLSIRPSIIQDRIDYSVLVRVFASDTRTVRLACASHSEHFINSHLMSFAFDRDCVWRHCGVHWLVPRASISTRSPAQTDDNQMDQDLTGAFCVCVWMQNLPLPSVDFFKGHPDDRRLCASLRAVPRGRASSLAVP